MVWGTVIVAIGQTILMTSLAEYCSIWVRSLTKSYDLPTMFRTDRFDSPLLEVSSTIPRL
jgi:hypothetical protein